jgi:prepilin-type N-terminal cleavage/methylation domain-containing protein
MKMSRVESREPRAAVPSTLDPRPSTGFTLIEVMVVVVLLSLIVIALMGVFNSTQAAFRASITQTDVLEGGRAAVDMITQDLKEMSPSLGFNNGAVNFFATNNPNYSPLLQSLVGVSNPVIQRTNVLENFFILSRENQTWTGTGYVVDTSPTASGINPLYRFSMTMPVSAFNSPAALYTNFITISALPNLQSNTNMHRLMDGVVTLRVRAYDLNGLWMNSAWPFFANANTNNIRFFPQIFGETGFYMFGSKLPASVEIEMATLEDRTLQRAESLGSANQSNYLAQQAGKVHVFRQRVAIPNVDSAAY